MPCLIFCLFASDVKLLRQGIINQIIRDWRRTTHRAAAPILSQLGASTFPGAIQLLIVIMCDGETVADVYPDATYYFYIALRPSTDRDELSDLLSGAATPFPSNATVFQSRCAKAGVERGDYP